MTIHHDLTILEFVIISPCEVIFQRALSHPHISFKYVSLYSIFLLQILPFQLQNSWLSDIKIQYNLNKVSIQLKSLSFLPIEMTFSQKPTVSKGSMFCLFDLHDISFQICWDLGIGIKDELLGRISSNMTLTFSGACMPNVSFILVILFMFLQPMLINT